MKTTVITIDGPAGAGKSTVAKALAARLDFGYLDTGAMYRALTLKALRTQTALEDEEALVRLARATVLRLEGNPATGLKVFLDEEDVTAAIRTAEVTNTTFYIARAPRVREIMVGWQREMGRTHNIVVEGRDIGTVVFPGAAYKFYLDADFEERSLRRIKELRERHPDIDGARIRDELKDRDHKDFTRPVGPLKQADDAVRIDSTSLDVDGVVEKILKYIRLPQERPSRA